MGTREILGEGPIGLGGFPLELHFDECMFATLAIGFRYPAESPLKLVLIAFLGADVGWITQRKTAYYFDCCVH